MLKQISITFMSGPKDGECLAFDIPEHSSNQSLVLTIGRREDMDICLNYDSQVSRLHAHLSYNGDRFWIEDTGSRNGTFLNEDRLNAEEPVPIDADTMFRVGRTWLRLDPLPTDVTAPAEPIHPSDIDPSL